MKSLEPIVSFFNEDGLPVQLIEGIRAEIEAVNKWMNMEPSINMTIGKLSPIAVCELMAPVIRQTSIGPLLMNSDLFIQLVNQLYFDLPDIVTSWEGVSEEYFQLVLLRALSVDIIEGNLGDATCSEENLRALLELSDSEDIAALSSLICSMDAVIQTELVQQVLIIIDFESAASKIRQLGDSNTNPLEEFSCSSFIGNGQEFTSNVITLIIDPTAFQLNLEIPGLAELVDDIFSMLENVTQGDLQELETLLELLEIFIGEDFFDEIDTVVIEELLNLYNLYLQTLNRQTGLIPIYSMWFNSSDVGYLLIRETGLSIQNVSMLMNGYLNSTEISELSNLTVLTWSRVVCEEDVFGRLLILPSDELVDLVHTELCQHPEKERLFGELQQMFSLFNFLRETAKSNVPTPSFTEYLLEIVTRIDILNTSVIENFLESTLPALQEIDDLSDVVTLLPLLDNITQVLNRDKYIVDVLRELPDLTLRKIIQDPDAFQAFLENELGIDPIVARNILDSQIRFDSLLSFNASEFRENVCSVDFFSRYLVFADGTNLTAVVETLCGQGTRDVVNIARVLLTQLDLTGSIDALTSNGLTDLFTNMTGSLQNISLALNDVQNLQGALPQLLASTSSLGEIFDDDTIERISRGETSALFEDNPDLFCGSAGTSKKRRRRQAPSGSSSDSSNGFCEDLYASLQEGEFGDLQWAFFQPILHGKIFYTPDTPVTRKIIEKANRPFQDILDIHDTTKAWLSGVGQLTDLLSSQGFKDIQTLLDNAYIRQLLESELEVDSGSMRSALQGDLTSLPTESIDQITVLAELVFNLTSCIELDRFKGFQSDELLAEEASFLHSENHFLAAIQFFGVDDLSDDSEIPKHMKYALRMDSARTPTTRDLLELYWYPTSRSDFATQEQYLHGYVFLQDLVERAIIQLHADNGLELSDVYIQQMPYPCHQNDRFLFIATIIFPLLFIVGFLVLIAIMTHQLVYEKERGIEELMKVMGLHGGVNWLAWFIINAIVLTVLMMIIILIIYIGGILSHSKVMVIFIFFICYVFAVIMMR
ncbi:putative ATP-binding cassette sub-family A member 2-like [Apostichopus japonicus]|uniref:Putative ATP-binding cassette sub-family A member 2-like n=1 Tax=Stichopus japonicus TaxID=307972 RepID=A0A2G8JJD6_STIJA|nr:putative ATP-binding cassette sub-family A member 2-like [Apostichopus japonicus]